MTDWAYDAGRFSRAKCTLLESQDPDGVVKRLQLGAGFFSHDGILLKAEYVRQTVGGFNPGTSNYCIDMSLDPEFSGLVVQAAVSI